MCFYALIISVQVRCFYIYLSFLRPRVDVTLWLYISRALYTISDTFSDVILVSPSQYAGWNFVDVLNRLDWSNSTLQRVFQEAYTTGPIMVACATLENKFYPVIVIQIQILLFYNAEIISQNIPL